jgi:Protein of unknown function (DUF1571)
VRFLLLGLLLLVCLILQDRRRPDRDGTDGAGREAVRVTTEPLAGPALARQELLAGLAVATAQAFPANLPWPALRQVAARRQQAIEDLIHQQPTTFLRMCLDRYDAEAHGYSCTLEKRERVKGVLRPREIVTAHFREQPFSVFMSWKQGADKAQRVLFVRGENHDKMLARPAGFLSVVGVVARDVDSPDVRASGRYLITQFGIKLGTVRTLDAMLAVQKRGGLHVTYEGVFRVPEVGDRLCYKLVRTPFDRLDEEGLNELTVYIDIENWLQVGSILKDASGKLIAEYFFRDLKLNPTFKANQFTRGAL